jgi:plastocyanin
MRRLTALVIAAGVALLCATPALARHHHHAKRKTVLVRDYYFSPHALKVKRGTKITWKWPGAGETGDVHDVKLKKGPRGVKHFHSHIAASDYHYTRKLTKPGTYRIICTIHHGMKLKIVVRK